MGPRRPWPVAEAYSCRPQAKTIFRRTYSFRAREGPRKRREGYELAKTRQRAELISSTPAEFHGFYRSVQSRFPITLTIHKQSFVNTREPAWARAMLTHRTCRYVTG